MRGKLKIFLFEEINIEYYEGEVGKYIGSRKIIFEVIINI